MTTSATSSPNATAGRLDSGAPRQDNRALWLGIAFSALWTGLIWLLAPRLAAIPHWPDSGAAWYYWRLMEPTTAARITAWGGYLLHQVAVWWLIWRAQRVRPGYSNSLRWFNVASLAVNALFILFHTVQTQLWYGALAEDVSIWSSQWSVILLLVLVVLMENQRRGLVLGKKVPWLNRAGAFTRRYHGFIFSWAVIYTFWYHPMEATQGHLIGFFYTFLFMLQGSLLFTRAHLNRWWTTALETMVLIHGTMVALVAGNGLWPMFAFGFGGVFVLTIVHGLPVPRWLRWAALALYVVLAVGVYSQRGLANIHQITWIPLTYYVVVFVVAGLIAGGLALYTRLRGDAPAASAGTPGAR